MFNYKGYLPDYYDPNIINSEKFEENSFELDGKTFKYKAYSLCWLKLSPEKVISFFTVRSRWEKDGFKKPIITHLTARDINNERVLKYRSMHPEEFDANEVEILKNLQLQEEKEK